MGKGAGALADVHPPRGDGKKQLPFLKVHHPVGQPQVLAQPRIWTFAERAVFKTHDMKGQESNTNDRDCVSRSSISFAGQID